MNLGTSFQLVDDLLDFTGDEQTLGKPAGADLVEGKVSLPLIFLLQRHPELRADIQTVIAEESYHAVPQQLILDQLEQTGALALAKERAVEYAEAAVTALNGLNHSPHAQALASIPAYIVERDR